MMRAYIGAIGSGKSYTCMLHALKFADEYDLYLVGNVKIKSMAKLEEYCWQMKYKNLLRKVRQGLVFVEHEFVRMAQYENCLILADELGVLLNKRDIASAWAKYRTFFHYCSQMRKAGDGGTHMFWMAQSLKQVDQEVLNLTNFYYHMNTFGNKIRYYTVFDPYGYQEWLAKRSFKNRCKYKAQLFPYTYGLYDQRLFQIYDTFQRFDGSRTYDLADIATQLGYARPHDNYEEVDEVWVDRHGVEHKRVVWNPEPRGRAGRFEYSPRGVRDQAIVIPSDFKPGAPYAPSLPGLPGEGGSVGEPSDLQLSQVVPIVDGERKKSTRRTNRKPIA